MGGDWRPDDGLQEQANDVWNHVGPSLRLETGVHTAQVRTYRGQGDPDMFSDLPVAIAVEELVDHLALPGWQPELLVQQQPFILGKDRWSVFNHRAPIRVVIYCQPYRTSNHLTAKQAIVPPFLKEYRFARQIYPMSCFQRTLYLNTHLRKPRQPL